MHRRRRCAASRLAVLAAVVGLVLPGAATAQEGEPQPVGQAATIVKVVKGKLADRTRKLKQGDRVYHRELITTGKESAATLKFRDGTELSMSANAKLRLTDVVYDPQGGAGKMVMEFVQGVFGFVSGDMPNDSYRVETATATMGVRGTAFAVQAAQQGQTAVRLLKGQVQVAGRAGGSQLLSQPGQTTTVPQGAPPTAPSAAPPAGSQLANLGSALGAAQPTALAQAAQAAGLAALATGLVPDLGGGDGGETEEEAKAQPEKTGMDLAEVEPAQKAPLAEERNRYKPEQKAGQKGADTGDNFVDIGVNVNAGTTGIGGQLEYRPWPFLGFRAGGSYAPLTIGLLKSQGIDPGSALQEIASEQEIANFSLSDDSSFTGAVGGLYADLHPLGSIPLLGNVRLTGGALYNGNTFDLSGSGTYTGATAGDAEVDLNFSGKFPDFSPYAGVGFSQTLFGIGVGADLGAYWQDTPSFSLDAKCRGVDTDLPDSQLDPECQDVGGQIDSIETEAENDLKAVFDNEPLAHIYPVARVMAVIRF